MDFGLDKRTEFVLLRGKLVLSKNIILDFNREIPRTRKNMKIPREWRKSWHIIIANERKFKEGIIRDIENITEFRLAYQE